MNISALPDDCEVAVIGAGPYGLSVAAHLKAAGVATHIFGGSMSFWRENMPRGMKLRSPWIATHISDPDNKFSLDVFARENAIASAEDQLPLEQFVYYGEWFQRQAVGDLDTRKVLRIEDIGRRFRLTLEDGDIVYARRVVIAMGLANQDFRPSPLQGLPAALVSHTCEHAHLGKWRGQRVAVVGRGQSACESAALLSEAGSEVDLICRGEVRWIGAPESDAPRDWIWRVRKMLQAPSAIGAPPLNWLNELPGVEHGLPAGLRHWISTRSLRPACTWWVKPRFRYVRVRAGAAVRGAQVRGNTVELRLDEGLHEYDHVLLATGYKIDIAKLRILAPELLQRIARTDGSPVLARGFESTVPRLHFVGASSVSSFGPLMRFIAGAGYAARSVTRAARASRDPASQDRASTAKLRSMAEVVGAPNDDGLRGSVEKARELL
jgi:cation diffusion facilitator CzcD-associated flavoprotein CzcO